MKIDDIKSIIELMASNGLTDFEMEENGVRICIKRGGTTSGGQALPAAPQMSVQTVAAPVAPVSAPAAAPVPTENDKLVTVKAPFVGTLYRSPSPEAEPYVKIGQEVSPETVLCIVEAMKVMNEIKSEVRGIVREVLVENAHAVQYGQPLFKIEKL